MTIDEDSLSELTMENDVHQLQNVNVKGRRRGRRAIDWNKPAYVRDAYDLYNDMTDYGLSFGMYDMRQFPMQVAKFLFGNMGRWGVSSMSTDAGTASPIGVTIPIWQELWREWE